MKDSLFRGFITAASYLPLPVARGLGKLLGEIAWRRNNREATITRVNIKLCFPALSDNEQEKLARASMRNWGMTVFEIPIIWHRGLKALRLIGTVHGEDMLKNQLASGRGSIIVSPHLGNWELAGLWLSTYGPTTSLYQPPKQQGVEDLIRAGRTKGGATLVPTNMRGISALIKALKNGEITGILPDMVPDQNGGVFAPFFGQQAFTMTLIHNLVKRSGAAVLLAFAKRTRKGFDIHILEPQASIYDTDAETSVVALNQLVESSVILAPEQYQWEYKRFKTRPQGEPVVYSKR